MKKVSIQLSVSEIDVVLSSLAKQPYEQVFNLISAIREQAIAQLKEEPEMES
jgi:hypothetical protein